ncbi:MAG: RNA-binding protein [Acidobacteriota bacterium]
MSSKVFVANLSFQTREEDLEDLFSEAGAIESVFLPTDRNTGRPRGFAFVEFDSPESAQKAVDTLNERELDGRTLRVDIAQDRPRREAPPRFGGGGPSRGGPPPRPSRPKGSRRGSRGKKRSL